MTMLSDPQKRALLELAAAAVRSQVICRTRIDPIALPLPEASGVFVTIRRRGELRGCLGTLDKVCRLDAEVVRCAADSASRDPRFPPVTAEELSEISLQISVLGPLEAIDPLEDHAFTIGRHGLVVEQGRRRGLLLPQVATEWSWTPEQFLRQTSLKAGLPPDAWRQGAIVYRFDAEVFGD